MINVIGVIGGWFIVSFLLIIKGCDDESQGMTVHQYNDPFISVDNLKDVAWRNDWNRTDAFKRHNIALKVWLNEKEQ